MEKKVANPKFELHRQILRQFAISLMQWAQGKSQRPFKKEECYDIRKFYEEGKEDEYAGIEFKVNICGQNITVNTVAEVAFSMFENTYKAIHFFDSETSAVIDSFFCN